MKKTHLLISLSIVTLLCGCSDRTANNVAHSTASDIQTSQEATSISETIDSSYVESSSYENQSNVEESSETQSYTDSDNVVAGNASDNKNIIYMDTKENEFTNKVCEFTKIDKSCLIGSMLFDLDQDGNDEAFVFVYSPKDSYSYDIWYLDHSLNLSKIVENTPIMFDTNDIFNAFYHRFGNDTIVIFNYYDSATSGAADVFLYRNGQLFGNESLNLPIHGYKEFDSSGVISVVKDFYGFYIEVESGQSYEDGMALGHCYIPYYFYYDNGVFKEFEATEVDINSLYYTWENRDFEKTPYDDIQVLKRDNGEVEVNVAIKDENGIGFSTYVYRINEQEKKLYFYDTFDGYYDTKLYSDSYYNRIIKKQ